MTTSYRRVALPVLTAAIVAGIGGLPRSSPAAADADTLTGHYLVRHTTNVPAPLFIAIEATDGDEAVTQVLQCVLPDGEQSDQIYCPQIDVTAPVDLDQKGQHASIIAVDFLPIEMEVVSRGFDILGIEESEEPTMHAAEAEWKGVPIGWECIVEEGDQTKCNTTCGGVGTVSAAPYPVNPMNPFMEPQCEVTCECPGGGSDTWIDPPQVMPAF